MRRKILFTMAVAAGLAAVPREAAAQLDPLLFLKRTKSNVLVLIDTSVRMQRDANEDYYDPNVYTVTGQSWEANIGVTAAMTRYRRRYVGLVHGPVIDTFDAARIETVGDQDQAAFATFEANTRLSVAKAALIEAINRNPSVVRWGLLRMRQESPRIGEEGKKGPVIVTDGGQQISETGVPAQWNITRPEVTVPNGSIITVTAPLVSPATGRNQDVLSILERDVRTAGALIPAGLEATNLVDAPIDAMLEDAHAEARRLSLDPECRNTAIVLIVGGWEGRTSGGRDPRSRIMDFVEELDGRRVPVHVIAIAPTSDAAKLQTLAEKSGGRYTEISGAMIDAAAGGPVAEIVHALNFAAQHTFIEPSTFNVAPTPEAPLGPPQEFQVTSPIIGSVNLENAKDILGAALPDTIIEHPITGVKIPQRSNLMVTTAFELPGFVGRLRGFRVYRPVADSTRPSGFRFTADGTRLWVADVPPAASRNIYTVLPDGQMVAFTQANVANLRGYLNTPDPSGLIEFIRNQPLGAIVGSTPAMMDAPSLDPPPDSEYPAFAEENKNRRTLIWIGANDGMMHAIDARLGREVFAFIPFNLLPKLEALRNGQPVEDFRYFVDSSPKVADVKIGGEWRTYLVFGEGAGGTFYQTLDVTLDDMDDTVQPGDDNVAPVLAYFADPTRVPFKWSFPHYSHFDPAIETTATPFGDVSATAPAVAKSVGETWSDPAIGRIETATGKFAVLTGSGFLRPSVQAQPNRNNIAAGTTFYLLDIETGTVFDSRNVGNDGLGESGADTCALANDCTKLKNALQADPVATGPADSRFITQAYIGDLDGKMWRFDIKLDESLVPRLLTPPTTVFNAGASHPLFSSMAAVKIGTQQYIFQGTGSDLLPSNGVSQPYKLLIVQDNGATGTAREVLLETTDGTGGDEKVTAFPAVAGDIVFFATTTIKPGVFCGPNVDANLYAFTFIGGPAYDTTGDGKVNTDAARGAIDTPRVRTSTDARASAPFIVDQHLIFAAGNRIELFGDPNDFNNGVGQAGVRILSWREVR